MKIRDEALAPKISSGAALQKLGAEERIQAPPDEAAGHRARSDSGLWAGPNFILIDRHSIPLEAPLQVLWLSHLDLIGPAAFRAEAGLRRPRSGRYLRDQGCEGKGTVLHHSKDRPFALTPETEPVIALRRLHCVGTESRA